MTGRRKLGWRTTLMAAAAGVVISALLLLFVEWAFSVPMDPQDKDPPRPAETSEDDPSWSIGPSVTPYPPGEPTVTPDGGG